MELKDLMLLKKDVRTYFSLNDKVPETIFYSIKDFFISKYGNAYIFDTPETLCLITDYIFDGDDINMENLHEIESFMTDEMIAGLEDILKPVLEKTNKDALQKFCKDLKGMPYVIKGTLYMGVLNQQKPLSYLVVVKNPEVLLSMLGIVDTVEDRLKRGLNPYISVRNAMQAWDINRPLGGIEAL